MEYSEIYKNFLNNLATKSKCIKAQQAAIVVKDNRIISFGYNGPPQKSLNCNEHENGDSICGKDIAGSCFLGIHAEQNAIAFAAREGIQLKGTDIYITQSPCLACAKLILAAQIKNVYYIQQYRLDEGLRFLNKHNVPTNIF